MAAPDDDALPDHAWDEAETLFTEEDDRDAPDLEILDDDLAAAAADAGLDMLIRPALEADDG